MALSSGWRWLALRVSDTGIGLDEGTRAHLFERFAQGDASFSRPHGGAGLGLEISRGLARLMGGDIHVASQPGGGSVFSLELPLSLSAARRAVPATQATAAASTSKRILIVDDNVDSAITLGHLLRSLGHVTEMVHDGAAALSIAADFRPDIVLLDIGLPGGLDGYEVARRLRAGQRGRSFRIIAITGWGQEADRQRAKEAGFDVHLVKPVDPSLLEHAIGERNGATLH
jgi:CheY-like chemotaxis protein